MPPPDPQNVFHLFTPQEINLLKQGLASLQDIVTKEDTLLHTINADMMSKEDVVVLTYYYNKRTHAILSLLAKFTNYDVAIDINHSPQKITG